MSHGPAGDEISAEPNLTPLLDVVLQLLMFFIMCVNFVNEQIMEGIDLPKSQSARPMDKDQTDVLFVNVKPYREDDKDWSELEPDKREILKKKFAGGEPCFLVPALFPMKILELKNWLRDEYRLKEDKATKEGKEVKTAVVIRADASCNYDDVYNTMNMCKAIGYKQMKLRAISSQSSE
jgi:biopolymer transport protein ExbD